MIIFRYSRDFSLRSANTQDALLVEESTSDKVVWSTSITSDENNVVEIDATSLVLSGFKIPIFDVNYKVKKFQANTLKSINSFPKNVNFHIQLASWAQNVNDADDSTVDVMFCMALLPDVPMTARSADRRIGYFEQGYNAIGIRDNLQNFHASDIDQKIHLISKWRLEKSTNCNAGGTLCDPVQPLIFHIDPSVPTRWRKYVKMGVEQWQSAFENIGFRNTPSAVAPGDSTWPKDYHAGTFFLILFLVQRLSLLTMLVVSVSCIFGWITFLFNLLL